MTKTIFIYIVVAVLVGIAAWFFMQKANNVADSDRKLETVVGNDQDVTPNPAGSEDDKDKWVKLPNGLQILDVVIGPGKEAKEGDFIATHYSGTLESGLKFDSSYDRGQPFSFILGQGMVIKGWDLGIVGMKVGGKRKLIIPADLGYGERGAGGAIPPGATLYFDVELMAAETPKK